MNWKELSFEKIVKESVFFFYRFTFFYVLYFVLAKLYYFTTEWALWDFHYMITITYVLHQIVFWFWNGILIYVDKTKSPAFLYKYKIQKDVEVSDELYRDGIMVALKNQVILLLSLSFIAYPYFQFFGVLPGPQVPTFVETVLQTVVCVAAEEIMFYYSHRWMHSKILYAPIHKFHHKFTAPVGISCEYAHPFEFAVSNMFPLIVGPAILGCHILVVWYWLCVAMMSTIYVHSGYEFPYSPYDTSKFHDLHHSKFIYNYGTIGILDWVHGTTYDEKKKQERIASS